VSPADTVALPSASTCSAQSFRDATSSTGSKTIRTTSKTSQTLSSSARVVTSTAVSNAVKALVMSNSSMSTPIVLS
jgi:hypothetical protein